MKLLALILELILDEYIEIRPSPDKTELERRYLQGERRSLRITVLAFLIYVAVISLTYLGNTSISFQLGFILFFGIWAFLSIPGNNFVERTVLLVILSFLIFISANAIAKAVERAHIMRQAHLSTTTQ